MSGLWVVLEEHAGRLTRLSEEAIAAAHKLGTQLGKSVSAVLVGATTSELAEQAAKMNLSRIVRIEHPLLAPYTADAFSLALEQFFLAELPEFVLFPHSYQVRDYAPALATRFGSVLIGDVIGIGEGPIFTRPLLQGRLHGHYRSQGAGACFFSVQAGAFAADSLSATTQPAEVTVFKPVIDAAQIRTQPGAPFRNQVQSVDLGAAQRIVSVGRGIREAANLPLVEALATALNAEVAASRPICDSGWLPLDRQVGSSGQSVAPRLYVAVGISGAMQHLVGMKASECIVAINKDPDAPIFEVADYGIVGDLFEVLPALTNAVMAAK
jgi:electron transfer flavoprotein alpha subunit